MKCPACKGPLREKMAGGMVLDTCYGGCGGIWFDQSELERVSARSATSLHSIWQVPVSNVKLTEPRMCPKCANLTLERKWFSDKKQVEIDVCPGCGGIWLDAGEFSRVYEEIGGGKVETRGWAAAMAEAAQCVKTSMRQPPGA